MRQRIQQNNWIQKAPILASGPLQALTQIRLEIDSEQHLILTSGKQYIASTTYFSPEEEHIFPQELLLTRGIQQIQLNPNESNSYLGKSKKANVFVFFNFSGVLQTSTQIRMEIHSERNPILIWGKQYIVSKTYF